MYTGKTTNISDKDIRDRMFGKNESGYRISKDTGSNCGSINGPPEDLMLVL